MDGTKGKRIAAWADKKYGNPSSPSPALARRGRATTRNTRAARRPVVNRGGRDTGGGDIPF